MNILLALCLLLLPLPALGQERPEPIVALANATVIDGTGAPPRAETTVLLRGDRIDAVFPSGERPIPEAAEIVDLTGRFLIPGLISAHNHFMNAGLAESAERVRGELRRMLFGGVTAARDANGDARLLSVLQRSLLLGEIEGPDVYYAAHMSGPAFIAADPRVARASAGLRPGTAPWMQAVTPETNVERAVARAAGTGATGLKIYVGVDAEIIRAITRAAHDQGLEVWAHTTVFPDRPSEVIRAGVDAVSHTCWLAWEDPDLDPSMNVPFVHTAPPEPRPVLDPALVEPEGPELTQLFQEMAARNVLLDATLSPYADDRGARRGCTTELTTALARRAHALGVPFVTGTDYYLPSDEPFPSMFREMEYLVDQGVLTPLEAITAATRNGARLLDQENHRGTIESGKAADLVVLRENPAMDIRALRSVEIVIKGGRQHLRSEYVVAGG